MATELCAVAVDQRYQELRRAEKSSKNLAQINDLLAGTFFPVLSNLSNWISIQTEAEILRDIESLSVNTQQKLFFPDSNALAHSRLLSNDYRFRIELDFDSFSGVREVLRGSSRSYNRKIVLAAMYTEAYFHRLVASEFLSLLKAFEGSGQLIEGSTFWGSTLIELDTGFRGAAHTAKQVESIFQDSHRSITQALSWLTVAPVGGLSRLELVRALLVAEDGRVSSPMLLAALGLGSGALGGYADDFFVPNPVEIRSDQRVSLSETFKSYMRETRERLAGEVGDQIRNQGCPVAKCLKGEHKSGLQIYLEAYFKVWKVVFESLIQD